MLASSRPLWAAALCLAASIVAADDRAKKADRVVDAVLEQEVRTTVARRADDLGDLVGQADRARWAAGYVRTADGWQPFDAAAPAEDRLREYEHRRGTEPLTPEQHLALANWCRDQKLRDQERAHLWAVLALHRNQPAVLQRLGYESIDGELLTRDDQADREAQEKRRKQQYLKWLGKAKSIQTQLGSANDGVRTLGRQQLLEINDPEAIPALEAELCRASSFIANEFVQSLSQRRNLDATRALMRQSVLSPWEAVRAAAGDLLRSRRPDQYVPTLLATVSAPIEMRLLDNGAKRKLVVGQFGMASGYIAMDDKVAFHREGWHQQYQLVVRRVGPVLEYGRMGIVTVLPGFYQGDGNIQLDNLNDAIRRTPVASSLEQSAKELAAKNAAIALWNERVSETLTRAAGFPAGINARQLWQQWATETHTEAAIAKPIVASLKTEITEETEIRFDPTNPSCLPAGTPVMTASGLRPIESLQIGDTVLAKDIETGELTYQPVIRTTVRLPQPLTTLHTKDDSIRATLGHYFWVSGKGWRMAKEIKPGDRLHGVQGTATVTDVSRGGREAVYNLVVEGANTYFVGAGKILSHDVMPPMPTDIIVPGLAAR